MIEIWERYSYREKPEYDPQNYCSQCGKYFGKNNLEEWEDDLVCRGCLKFLEEMR